MYEIQIENDCSFDFDFSVINQSELVLGYLVPILNTLLDANAYTGLPKGCSPKAIVVCSTWESAEMVHSYCTRIMKRVPVTYLNFSSISIFSLRFNSISI